MVRYFHLDHDGDGAVGCARTTKTTTMKLQEIKEAVLAGKTVHWKNAGYEVMRDKVGQWFIICCFNGSLTSLTWADGVTMNEREEDFFLGEGRANEC